VAEQKMESDGKKNDMIALMNHIGMLRRSLHNITLSLTLEHAQQEAKDALAQGIKEG